MKRAISALLCAAASTVTVSTAEARPHHHHHHHRRYRHGLQKVEAQANFFSAFRHGF
ncbi:hypothetical protein [Bradyrhizobium sp. STM 3562]|uniref:hypothetical protein n=1 Tax=Bradyrhizobium sp. STM 3562 TaxID=578924 RepID=UPI00388D4A92